MTVRGLEMRAPEELLQVLDSGVVDFEGSVYNFMGAMWVRPEGQLALMDELAVLAVERHLRTRCFLPTSGSAYTE
jgi:hypothetical protein